MKKRILVTGVAGFIGSAIARALIAEGHHVIGVDDFSNGRQEHIPDGVDFIEADLSKIDPARFLSAPLSQIFHLAGQSSGEISFDNPSLDLEKNTVSTLKLIELGMLCGSERIIYASSMSVYGDLPTGIASEDLNPRPLSCYGASKSASESYLKIFSKSLPFVALRMFNVYGRGQDLQNLRQGMVSIFVAQAVQSGHVIVRGSGNRYRDFVHIDDVTDTWLRASGSSSALGQTINVGTGVKTSVEELIARIKREIPSLEVTYENPTPGDQLGIIADTRKLSRLLEKSSFVSLDDGLSDFIHWARATDLSQPKIS